MSASGMANRSIELHNGQPEQPLLQTIEEEREEEIDHQNRDERQDERFGRRPADAFAAGPAMKPAMTTNEGDKHPENYGFREAREDVPQAEIRPAVHPIMVRLDSVNAEANHRAAEHAHHVGEHRQEGDQEHARQKP